MEQQLKEQVGWTFGKRVAELKQAKARGHGRCRKEGNGGWLRYSLSRRSSPAGMHFLTQPYDCRSLFEPIDYVAFDGMTTTGKVDQIAFIDVKTGASRLNSHQRANPGCGPRWSS